MKTLIDIVDGNVEDASDDGFLDHVLEPSSIGVGPADRFQNGGPTRYPRV